jgi:hypothetical protein
VRSMLLAGTDGNDQARVSREGRGDVVRPHLFDASWRCPICGD